MSSDQVKELLRDVLVAAGYAVDDVVVESKGDNEYYVNILSEQDAVHLIGRGGENLRALQSVMKNIFRSQSTQDQQIMIKIDVDSYRLQQEDHVKKIADTRAQRVLQSGNKVSLPPMSSFFRRLVHLHVKENYPELETFSHGGAMDRAVCIALKADAQAHQTADEEVSSDIYAELEL